MALLGLGAFHGINPGMGWLFAVALGLQEQRRSAVWNALPPIAVGHALSVGLVVALVALIHASIPYRVLRWIAAAVLIGFGVYRLVRARHPRWVGIACGLSRSHVMVVLDGLWSQTDARARFSWDNASRESLRRPRSAWRAFRVWGAS